MALLDLLERLSDIPMNLLRRCWVFAVLLAFLFLPSIPSAAAAQETVFATGLGPIRGIALDALGNIYVATSGRGFGEGGAISRLSPDGATLGHWGIESEPAGVAVSPASGNVFVSSISKVFEFTASGLPVAEWGDEPVGCSPGTTFSSGFPIAVAATGSVFVAKGACVEKFSESGERLAEWGGVGSTPGKFTLLGGIVAVSGAVYVVDQRRHVQEFDEAGSFIGEWGAGGAAAFLPSGLALGSGGELLLDIAGENSTTPFRQPPLNYNNNVIEKRSLTGVPLGTFGISSGTNGDVAASPSGLVYASVAPEGIAAIDPTEPAAWLETGLTSYVLTGTQLHLDAEKSQVPFASPTDFSWDLGTGAYSMNTGTTGSLATSFATPGVRTVGVRVTAPSGKIATATKQVDVRLAPPAGPVGMTIDEGDFATNTPHVMLTDTWFPGATGLTVSNDGGFGAPGGTQQLALGTPVEWTLEGGSERLPKTVYLRFTGAGQDTATFTDDIILDTTTPIVAEANLVGVPARESNTPRKAPKKHVKARRGAFKVHLKAKAKLSGVSAVAFGVKKKAIATISLRGPRQRGVPLLRKAFIVKSRKQPRFVRVRNAAGTWSKWGRIR